MWLVARIIDEVQARWPGQNKNCASLAGVGSFGLELRVLSRETGDPAYASAAATIAPSAEHSTSVSPSWSVPFTRMTSIVVPRLRERQHVTSTS